MKIITYSDLHLESGCKFKPIDDTDVDLMILSGDIITFKDFTPLTRFLTGWNKPILYVSGNHEYYTRRPSDACEIAFQEYLKNNHPNVTWLNNSEFILEDIHFFGGTMWTDFDNSSKEAIELAIDCMNDYRYIINPNGQNLSPYDTIEMHEEFKVALINWLERTRGEKRVVITHHAPTIKPNTRHVGSKLTPAFNSIDMVDIIKQHQPNLWFYGHTHECDDHTIGKTRILSNQKGYTFSSTRQECKDFDEKGLNIII